MNLAIAKVLDETGLYDRLTKGQIKGERFYILDGWDTVREIEQKVKDAGIQIQGIDDVLNNWGFDDAYCKCSGCMNVFNLYPAYYGEPQQYVVFENEGYFCVECAIDFKDEYLAQNINNPMSAVQKHIVSEKELEKSGFVKLNEISYEQGYHEGQDAEPQKIFHDASHKYNQVLFVIDNVGQFDVAFSVWGKNTSE